MSQKSQSPKSCKQFSRQRPLRVVVLGLPSVGKTALTVRFITKRFIGEYDPTLEKKYTFHTEVDDEQASFDILDTAGQNGDSSESAQLEEYLRWADAYVLVYCITDRCSLEECTRLKFLITHAKRSRKSSSPVLLLANDLPIVLVGNKNDLEHDRMVSPQEGQLRSAALGCSAFHEISVRESHEEAAHVFRELLRKCRQATMSRKSFRRSAQIEDSEAATPPNAIALRKRDRGVVIGYSHPMDAFSAGLGDMGGRLRQRETMVDTRDRPDRLRDREIRVAPPPKEPLRRKESVSRRFIRKVIPSRSLSARDDMVMSNSKTNCATDSSDG